MIKLFSEPWLEHHLKCISDHGTKKKSQAFCLHLELDTLLRYIVSQASSESVVLKRTSVILLTHRASAVTVNQSHWSLLTEIVPDGLTAWHLQVAMEGKQKYLFANCGHKGVLEHL